MDRQALSSCQRQKYGIVEIARTSANAEHVTANVGQRMVVPVMIASSFFSIVKP